ncbi:acyl-CoA dehydrogenase family protein [Fictibacillus sp. Mic-4]|uniref:acyl-CoA dehydrogenase family protein n=1 Tax=Fictibacillus sp. Mic-4 TaxID=3132826 RepID=UPI003CF3AE19
MCKKKGVAIVNDGFIKTKTQQKIMKKLKAVTPQFVKREHELTEKGSFPFENIQDLKDIGYTSISLPKEFGGEEISLYDFLLFQEQIARGCGSTALSIGWHVGIVMDLAENRTWEPTMFSYICEQVKKGALLNRAATERQTGSPTRGGKPATSASRHKGGWSISGRKTFTTMSPVLDYFLVTASIEGTDEVGEFLIPKTVEGVSIEETWDSVAMRGTASHDLVMHEVKIPQEYLVEKKIPGKSSAKNSGWLLHIPACYLGIATAARNYCLDFAAHYQPNSLKHPIGQLPTVEQAIGKMELELMQARHFLYSVAEKYDSATDRNELKPELAAAKYIVTNSAISIVDHAMRIVGARSLSEANPLQRYYLNVRAGLHNPPMDDSTLSLLANHALKTANEKPFVSF